MIKKPGNPNGNAHRVITFLTRDELDFLDKISKDALFSAGTKISRSKIISAMVNVIRKLNIDGRSLTCKKELESKIMQAIKEMNNKKPQSPKTIVNPERKGGQNGPVL